MILNNKLKYLAISDMLLTITLLSNDFNKDLDNDSFKVIKFIGKSFNWSNDEIEKYHHLISDNLTVISRLKDIEAFKNDKNKKMNEELESLLYLKCETLSKIKNIFNQYQQSDFDESYFDYEYLRPYYEFIRFNELLKASAKGNIDINRTVAFLLAFGIGCKANRKAAKYKLKQCVYWGDYISLFYLSYLSYLMGEGDDYHLYLDLSNLYDYIIEGKTVLPQDIKKKLNKKVIEEFSIISSITLDIRKTNNLNDINYSFIEVILKDSISYSQKMNYINDYKYGEWREELNSTKGKNSLFFEHKEVIKDE